MTVLRQSLLLLWTCGLTVGPALATPSDLAERYAGCAGRLDAAFAATSEVEAMRGLLEAALPAAHAWGMPPGHVAGVRARARATQ
ncbi:MAG: hypothetical protein WBA67_13295, partial [Jannaschia sp.]